MPQLYNVKHYLKGHLSEDCLSLQEKEILNLLPKAPMNANAMEILEHMNIVSESLNNPKTLFRKLNIVIQKRKDESILYPKTEQIQELYSFLDHVDSKFFIGFIQDELLENSMNAICDTIELNNYVSVDVVFVRNSLLKEKSIVNYCKYSVATAIMSFRKIPFYHRRIVFSLIKLRYPDSVLQNEVPTEKKKINVTTTLPEAPVAKRPRPQIAEPESEDEPSSKRMKNDWCLSSIGLEYTYAWKLVFIRNSPVRLSERGQEVASKMRSLHEDDSSSKTNGKCYESDFARTMEHFLHLITRIQKLSFESEFILPWILKMYSIFKLYRAFELQVRYSNSPEEPDIMQMENSRKSKEFTVFKDESKIRRTNKDKEEVATFFRSFMELFEINFTLEEGKKIVLPSQHEVLEKCLSILSLYSVDEIVAVSSLSWDDVEKMSTLQAKIWNDFCKISKLICMFTALIRKAPSFGIQIKQEMIKIPMLLGTNEQEFNSSKKSKKVIEACNESNNVLKKLFGYN